MEQKQVTLSVYGAETICPSCVGSPSSVETYEWLEAAIGRKFPDQPVQMTYVDIFNPPADENKQAFATRVIDEDLFYPVVLIEDEIVGEGNPSLKKIFSVLEQYGYQEAAR